MKRLELDLDVYQGPFDLLFTLILKEEVDICEIPLVEIILAYLEHSVQGDDVDWEALSEFLVLIAALLELKSRVLLPGFEAPCEELDPDVAREILVERLVAYRRFKAAAEGFEGLLDDQRGRVVRAPCREHFSVRPPLEAVAGRLQPQKLKDKLNRLLQVRRGPELTHLARIKVDLPRQIAIIRRLLSERGSVSFEQTFRDEEPLVQAVGLLAVIDLLSRGEVAVEQSATFADIRVSAREMRKIA